MTLRWKAGEGKPAEDGMPYSFVSDKGGFTITRGKVDNAWRYALWQGKVVVRGYDTSTEAKEAANVIDAGPLGG